ncbi:coiled-coil domain-containing protein R3HCC1L-like protein, partial [Leptotrombidium deliense]
FAFRLKAIWFNCHIEHLNALSLLRTLDSSSLCGRFLNANELNFADNVLIDVEFFVTKQNVKSILLFPPLLKRYRFLLHQIVDQHFGCKLCTKSFGKEGRRQTFVYFKEMERKNELESKLEPKKTKKRSQISSKRSKRPDMKLYVPPAAKHESDDRLETFSELNLNEKTDSSHGISEETDKEESSFDAECDCSWDAIYDDNGECLKPELISECQQTLNLKENEVIAIEKTTIDYYNFQPFNPNIDEAEFPHVLEAYGFPAEFKTQDLFTSLSVYNSRNFDIKWVDDTHALVIFSSNIAAADALKMPYHNMKVRPLSQAIRESKVKAKKCSEFLVPFKQRPETSAALARRLVTGALGLRTNITPEQRAAERRKLVEAKERKKQAAKQTQDIWEGNVN